MGVVDTMQGGWEMTKTRISTVGKIVNQISHAHHVWSRGYDFLGRVRWSGDKMTAPFKFSSVRIDMNGPYPPITKAGKEWHPPVTDCIRCWTVWHRRKGQKVIS